MILKTLRKDGFTNSEDNGHMVITAISHLLYTWSLSSLVAAEFGAGSEHSRLQPQSIFQRVETWQLFSVEYLWIFIFYSFLPVPLFSTVNTE